MTAKLRRLPVAIALAAVTLLVACGDDDSEPSSASAQSGGDALDGASFGFAYGIENSPIYASVLAPAKDRAAELGVKLQTGSANGDCDTQIQNMQNMLASGVKALTFTGICGKGGAYDTIVRDAKSKGVSVVSYAFTHPDADGSITWDDRQGAQLLGRDIVRWLRRTFDGDYSNFSWGLFPCSFAPPPIQLRTSVVKEIVVAETGKQPLEADCALDPKTGQDATEQFLQKEPQLNVLVSLVDAGALGAVKAIAASPTVDKTKVYVGGIDGQREAVSLIADGGAGGLYRGTAALNVADVGHDVLSVPAALVTGTGDPTSVVHRYRLISVEDRGEAKRWYEAVFGSDG